MKEKFIPNSEYTDRDEKERKNKSSNSEIAHYLKEVVKIPLLTPEEERKLIIATADGDKKAREKLINANLRLVIYRVFKYNIGNMPLNDLVGFGNIGLIKAVDKIDPSKNTRFSTYAVYWIDREIVTALLNYQDSIRKPVTVQRKIFRYHQMDYSELNKLSNEEIQELEEAYSFERPTISLDEKIKSDEVSTLNDIVSDGTDANEIVSDAILTNEMYEIVQNCTFNEDSLLNERERQAIIIYFGLGNTERMSMQEIADIYGVSRERISKIIKHGLKCLKTYLRIYNRDLFDIYNNEKITKKRK